MKKPACTICGRGNQLTEYREMLHTVHICRQCQEFEKSMEGDKMSTNSTYKFHHYETIQTDAEGIVVEVGRKRFTFSIEYIQETLLEGWMEDESMIFAVDGVQLELYPKDFRRMRRTWFEANKN